MPEILLVKLGGSIITDKNNADYNVASAVVQNCLLALKHYLDENPDTKLILIHGAGGHIHHLAKTYELTTSCTGNEEKLAHAYEVQRTTKRLSDDIIALANKLNFPLTQIPTCAVVTNKDGLFETIATERIEQALASRRVPLLYGDMVPDANFGLSICSGDTLITKLAPLIGATRVIYVSDIDGLYTCDPHQDSTATLIENISVAELQDNHIAIGASHSIDVTGGLKNKLAPVAHLFATTPTLTTIEICNGIKPQVVPAVLSGQPIAHTTIVA